MWFGAGFFSIRRMARRKYQTVHLKELTDFPKKDEKDPTEVFTDIHFEKKSVAHEAYHLSHGFYH